MKFENMEKIVSGLFILVVTLCTISANSSVYSICMGKTSGFPMFGLFVNIFAIVYNIIMALKIAHDKEIMKKDIALSLATANILVQQLEIARLNEQMGWSNDKIMKAKNEEKKKANIEAKAVEPKEEIISRKIDNAITDLEV